MGRRREPAKGGSMEYEIIYVGVLLACLGNVQDGMRK
jgi:hypothetical protein